MRVANETKRSMSSNPQERRSATKNSSTSRRKELTCRRANCWYSLVVSVVLALSVMVMRTEAAFVPRTAIVQQRRISSLPCSTAEDFNADELSDRLKEMRIRIMEQDLRRPPNPDLSPQEFVVELLDGLWRNSEPLPDSGFRLLLRASTKDWRTKLYESVGAPLSADQEVVASALGEAMSRPSNQFGILVAQAETYETVFPTDPLDYADGTCWVECRLRSKFDNELLVATGWQLEQRSDGAWLVDGIDWQDFREAYRPGIGREEWMRICG